MKIVNLNVKAQKILGNGVKILSKSEFLKRLIKKDASLWKKDAQNKKIIINALGWVDVTQKMLKNTPNIINFVNLVKRKFDSYVVLGMGGSSLAPEVFRTVFKTKKGYPKLFVLDTTNPSWIVETERKIKLKRTLFIFASKSGTTVEPHSQFAYFYGKLKKLTKNPSRHFIAITDPNTPLQTLAQKFKFRKIFINPQDIGGRFAALSYFGLIPAAIMGVNIRKLLVRAVKFSKKYLKTHSQNPALILGSVLGRTSQQGIDKLTLLMPKKIESFSLWIEQLIAESTGKQSKGIIPIAQEPIIKNFNYAKDRIFVNFSIKNTKDKLITTHIKNLQKQNHPIINIHLFDTYDLAVQFFLWELATAAAGHILKINPFSQPDVEQSKVFMKNILNSLSAKKRFDAGKKISIRYSKPALKQLKKKNLSLRNLGKNFYSLIKKNNYVGILAYLNGNKKTHRLLKDLRKKIIAKKNVSTLFGYGPRYLHSTGQLHKGGGNNGIFLILTPSNKPDVKITGKPYTFWQLMSAQNLGDFQALEEKGRTVIKIDLPNPVKYYLKSLINIL
jgi:glucose-6-phosphate isomerase